MSPFGGAGSSRWRAPAAVLVGVWLALLAHAPVALAHAQLLGTQPLSGSTVRRQPREVIFEFDQNVGGTLGAVRVYNARGQEVDNLDVSHPESEEHWLGVGLKPHLPDGTYTATYRVISADTHIVYGGLVFNIGHAGAAPRFTVAGLIGRNESGEVTRIAFGVVRDLDYLTLALMIGGLAFLYVGWLPSLQLLADDDRRWAAASRAFAGRFQRLLALAAVLGVVVSVLGVLLQGASAAGVSLWSSLKGSVIDSTLESRFGEVWGARAIDWVLLGSALVLARLSRKRASSADSGGDTDVRTLARAVQPPVPLAIVLVFGCAYLAVTPAFAGHASIQSPTGVFFPSDVLHVLAASVWVGGIACLLLAVPAATRQLEGAQRSRLLLGVLAGFSPIALASVLAVAATGVIQAVIDVRSFEALVHTTYGALVIAKSALLAALIGLGWVNRARIMPVLGRLVRDERPPGATGVRARLSLRGELALMICVLGVTAALVSYAPPIDAVSGPFSTNTTLGPAELEMTVEPATVGPNTIHLYLIDARTGAPFTATRELTATASLPARRIGPLPLRASAAGPGHYILSSAVLSPGGTWSIEMTDRVSEFEQYTRAIKVPIR